MQAPDETAHRQHWIRLSLDCVFNAISQDTLPATVQLYRRQDNITSSPRDTSRPAQTNQVCSQLETPQEFEMPTYQPSTSAPNPNEREFDILRVEDRGSKSRRAHILVEGVPTDGVIDSGTDITILGGALFRQVVAVGKIKPRSLKEVDKVPRTYDQRPFS